MIAHTMENGPASGNDFSDPWQDRAHLLRALAHPARLAILELLCQRPRCVKEINALIPIAQAHLSQHMAALRKANLVASHACGTLRCYYILQPTLLRPLIPLLRQQHAVRKRDCDSIMREARRGRKTSPLPPQSQPERR